MGALKNYTDFEQSKKLAKILQIESADGAITENYHCVPCWSLAVLLSIVPNVSLNNFTDGTWNAMVERNGKMVWADKNNPLDACVELIIKLHELKLL